MKILIVLDGGEIAGTVGQIIQVLRSVEGCPRIFVGSVNEPGWDQHTKSRLIPTYVEDDQPVPAA